MTRRSHHGLGIAAVALALGLGGACGNTVSYTYVDVDVEVDTASLDATHLFLVTRCEFTVSGADETSSGVGLPCRENNVRPRVGTFQWSSEATSGSLQFTVNLFDANRVVLGSGTSDPVAVSPGKHLTTSVLVWASRSPTRARQTPVAVPTPAAPRTRRRPTVNRPPAPTPGSTEIQPRRSAAVASSVASAPSSSPRAWASPRRAQTATPRR